MPKYRRIRRYFTDRDVLSCWFESQTWRVRIARNMEFCFRRRTVATRNDIDDGRNFFCWYWKRRGKRGEQIDEHIHTYLALRIRTRKRTRTRTRTKDREKKRGQQGTRYGILRASRVLFYVYLCLNIHQHT